MIRSIIPKFSTINGKRFIKQFLLNIITVWDNRLLYEAYFNITNHL